MWFPKFHDICLSLLVSCLSLPLPKWKHYVGLRLRTFLTTPHLDCLEEDIVDAPRIRAERRPVRSWAEQSQATESAPPGRPRVSPGLRAFGSTTAQSISSFCPIPRILCLRFLHLRLFSPSIPSPRLLETKTSGHGGGRREKGRALCGELGGGGGKFNPS